VQKAVTGSMVLLMANSLGTATRVIEMTQLTDELRNTMSMLSRDIRRANYNPYALYCYADPSCGTDAGSSNFRFLQPIGLAGGSSCVIYFLERGFSEDPDNPSIVGGGGFRLVTSDDSGLGDWIEVWSGAGAPPSDCGGASGAGGWEPITDPSFVDITGFVIDTTGSLGQTIRREDGSAMLSTETCEVRVTLTGALLKDSIRSVQTVVKSIQDVIRVRNDYLSPPDGAPDNLLCS
jgi:hypothetical protein